MSNSHSNENSLEGSAFEQSTLLSAILDQMAEGVIVADHEGRFRFFNRQAQHLLGGKPNVPPDQWTRYFQTQRQDESGGLRPVPADQVPLVRALAGEEVDNEEYFLGRGRGHTGAWISVNSRPLRNAKGESMGAVSVCRDITALKSAEQGARRAREDFQKVIEASLDGVGIHREGRWVYANPALLSALGFEEMSDLLGTSLSEILPPEEIASKARDWMCGPIEGKRPSPQEFDFVRRDGGRVSMEVCPAFLTDFQDEEAVLIIFRDVSRRKQLEGQLRISERMALLGTVASGVGHEINNPLSIVTMNLELALQDVLCSTAPGEKGPGTTDMLNEALVAAQRIGRIVADLRVLSPGQSSSPSAVDLEAVLDSTAGVLLNELRFRAVLIKRYAPSLPKVRAVEGKLAQVILNLLLNAVQSIPEGHPESNSIVLSTEQVEDGSVQFSVSDTGSGIAPEVARRMFTPFFTTKPVGEGSGLGLSLCYRVVTDLGGTLTYRTIPNQGSTFVVKLPAVSIPERGRQRDESPPAVSSQQGRILVVDDEPSVCKVLERSLRREHLVEVCEDGLSALRHIKAGSRYDVILCDVMMPRMTGLQLYEALTAVAPDQADRMIFLTGGAFSDSAKLSLLQTTRPVLYKPCELDRLRREVRAALVESRRVG